MIQHKNNVLFSLQNNALMKSSPSLCGRMELGKKKKINEIMKLICFNCIFKDKVRRKAGYSTLLQCVQNCPFFQVIEFIKRNLVMLALNTSLPKGRTVMQFGMFRAIWSHSENASSCFRFICSLVQSRYDDEVNICHLRLLATNRVHLKKWISITFSSYFFQRTKSPLLGFQFSVLRLD